MSTLLLAGSATTPPQGLSKEEFGRQLFSIKDNLLYTLRILVSDECPDLDDNDVSDISKDILSKTFENVSKNRDKFDQSIASLYTWVRKIAFNCFKDWRKTSYRFYEISDELQIDIEEEDESDIKPNHESDQQQFIDWVNTGGGDIADEPCIKLSKQENRSRIDDYLKDRLESLMSIKNIREYKKQNPEYTLPETLELLPHLSDLELDIAVAKAKRVPSEKICSDLGKSRDHLNQIICRMKKKAR